MHNLHVIRGLKIISLLVFISRQDVHINNLPGFHGNYQQITSITTVEAMYDVQGKSSTPRTFVNPFGTASFLTLYRAPLGRVRESFKLTSGT